MIKYYKHPFGIYKKLNFIDRVLYTWRYQRIHCYLFAARVIACALAVSIYFKIIIGG